MFNDYELTDNGLVTSDPVIAAMFLWSDEIQVARFAVENPQHFDERKLRGRHLEDLGNYPICIPRAIISEAIEAVEDEACFWWHKAEEMTLPGEIPPNYGVEWSEKENHWITALASNTITLGKTVGELRALIAWCKAE